MQVGLINSSVLLINVYSLRWCYAILLQKYEILEC